MGEERRPRRRLAGCFALVLVAVVVWLGFLLFAAGPAPTIALEPEIAAIGPATPVEVHVKEPSRGLSRVLVELRQGEKVFPLAEESYEPRPFWAFWREATSEASLELELGHRTLKELKEGDASLRVEAGRAPAWFRRPAPVVLEKTLAVRRRPPVLELADSQNYATQGGSGIVRYRVGPTAFKSGVRSGGWYFPGYPVPGGAAGDRFAFFGVPYDLAKEATVELVAADEVGNERSMPFLAILKRVPLKTDEIPLDDAFLSHVVPAIQAETPALSPTGDLLEDYLAINRDLRRQNAEELVRLAAASASTKLWQGAFQQMPNSQVMSAFADRRTYVYQGRPVDRQDHLGFDLASTQMAPVPASNAGKVVLARFFGIYGKTVVLDHGYGLLSLYAHLSNLEVSEGDTVAQGQTVGRSGQTGLAGGDHLHFTLLLHGLAVNPVEWWDERWIRLQVEPRLGGI